MTAVSLQLRGRSRRGLDWRAFATRLTIGMAALSAQTAGVEAEDLPETWRFGGELYGWISTIDTETTAGDEIEMTFSDIMEDFEIGAMGLLAAQYGRFGMFADVIYLDISDDMTTTAGMIGVDRSVAADVELKAFISTFGASYVVYHDETTILRGVGGARYLWMDVDADLDLGARTENVELNQVEWNGIVGLRGRSRIADRVHVNYYGDVGTGESDVTYQLVGSVDYDLGRTELSAGYRYLRWEFDGPELDHLEAHGPFLGLKFEF